MAKLVKNNSVVPKNQDIVKAAKTITLNATNDYLGKLDAKDYISNK